MKSPDSIEANHEMCECADMRKYKYMWKSCTCEIRFEKIKFKKKTLPNQMMCKYSIAIEQIYAIQSSARLFVRSKSIIQLHKMCMVADV